MNNKFDELTKQMAQSVTRRGALKKFGVGLAGMALACLGLESKAAAAARRGYCQMHVFSTYVSRTYTGLCVDIHRCISGTSADCPAAGTLVGDGVKGQIACGGFSIYNPVDKNMPCSFTA